MRLYDQLMDQGRMTFPRGNVAIASHNQQPVDIASLGRKLGKALKEAHVIIADNVVEYAFSGTNKSRWTFEDDFPCLKPPLPTMFVETKAPPAILTDDDESLIPWKDFQPDTHAWGVLVSIAPPNSVKGMPAGATELVEVVYFERVGTEVECGGWVGLPINDKGEYVTPYTWDSWGKSVSEADREDILTDTDKDTLEYWKTKGKMPGVVQAMQYTTTGNLKWDRMHVNRMVEFCKPLLLAISFMHCTNVTQEPFEVYSRQLTRARKRAKKPLYRYHVLDIKPFQKAAKRIAADMGEDTPSAHRAIHIARGHFAHYSADRPLFGKYSGTFWVPAHVRGSKKEGVVVKDYNVKEAQ